MDPDKYFSGHNLKNTARKQKFGYARKYAFGLKICTLRHVAYIAIDFKMMVSDLFHAGSTLVESESIKRRTKLSE